MVDDLALRPSLLLLLSADIKISKLSLFDKIESNLAAFLTKSGSSRAFMSNISRIPNFSLIYVFIIVVWLFDLTEEGQYPIMHHQ